MASGVFLEAKKPSDLEGVTKLQLLINGVRKYLVAFCVKGYKLKEGCFKGLVVSQMTQQPLTRQSLFLKKSVGLPASLCEVVFWGGSEKSQVFTPNASKSLMRVADELELPTASDADHPARCTEGPILAVAIRGIAAAPAEGVEARGGAYESGAPGISLSIARRRQGDAILEADDVPASRCLGGSKSGRRGG